MDYLSQRLTSLRQEITDLRSMNTLYAQRNQHTAIEQSACELRTTRLLEIKKELTTMRNHPAESAVWWEKFGAPRA